jgi:hypothetical protein
MANPRAPVADVGVSGDDRFGGGDQTFTGHICVSAVRTDHTSSMNWSGAASILMTPPVAKSATLISPVSKGAAKSGAYANRPFGLQR